MKIETSVIEKNGKYLHTVNIDDRTYTRNSKKRYKFAILVDEGEGAFVLGYSSSLSSAESSARQCRHMAKAWVIEL